MLREYLLGILSDECTVLDCPPQLEYWETLLSLIEAAQLYSRQQVDESRRNSSHTEEVKGETHGLRTSTAENTATGRTCSWQTAISEQSFNRTSTDNTVAFSETNSQRYSQRKEDGFDKSTRNTHGQGSTSYTHHLGDTHTQRENGLQHSFYHKELEGGTGPLEPYEKPFGPGINFDILLEPPFITFQVEDNRPGEHPGYNVPWGAICPEFPDEHGNTDCVRPTVTSIGHGWSRDIAVSLAFSIPFPGGPTLIGFNISTKYCDGLNERQFYTRFCTGLFGFSTEEHTDIHSSTWNQNERDTATSRETTTILHLVRKTGSSIRRGTLAIDAEERQIGQARGSAANTSEREGTGFGHTQQRKEALTVENNTLSRLGTSHTQSLSTAHKYGQIGQHLNELHDRILKHIMMLSRQLVAIPVGGHMGPALASMPYSISRCYTPRCKVQGFCSCNC